MGRTYPRGQFRNNKKKKKMSRKPSTIERKVADTILQIPQSIEIGGRKYRIANMPFASVVEMSAEVSEIPVSMSESEDNPVVSVLRHGREYGDVPRILAVMMVSAVWLLFGRFGHWVFRRKVGRKARLLSVRHSSRQLNEAAQVLIERSDLADFFALSTFLAGINMTKATKVETEAQTPTTETTASGL